MRPGVDIDRRGAGLWEAVGVLFIIGAGAIVHFAFDWANGFRLIAPFAAVNESVWEHLKMAFWPAIVWALLEHVPLRGRVNNFPLAKTAGILTMTFAIPLLYYAYTGILGYGLFAVDAILFVICVLAGQYLSYRLMTGDERSPHLNRTAPLSLVVVAILFIVFTFATPHAGLFMDGPTGVYGIP
jgi:asparagine N-glycosylation enzyme membrane subunit Stt3